MFPKPAKPKKFPAKKAPPATPGLTGSFSSSIPTAAPLAGSQLQQVSTMKPVFSAPSGGTGAADQTRSAFARALSDSANTATQADIQDFNLGLQRKSQDNVARDIQQQRQIGTDRFGMGRQAATARADIANRRAQGMADIATKLSISRKNADAAALDNAVNFTVGAMSLFSPTGAFRTGTAAATGMLGGLLR
jgi:hypothetical protein